MIEPSSSRYTSSDATKTLGGTGSFADMVKGKKTLTPTTVDLSKLPKPTLKEGKPALEIPQEFFQEGCMKFQHSFIARLDFTGLKFSEVKKTLESQWQLERGIKFLPMSNGFFIIMLSTAEDKEQIRNGHMVKVNNQELKLQDWYPSFNPNRQCASHAIVWVLFP